MSVLEVIKSTKTQLGNDIYLFASRAEIQSSAKTLIIGVFHGDEPQGKFLIEEYLKRNSNEALHIQGEGMSSFPLPDSAKKNSELLFVPCLNPDGMQLGRRTNANGVDLNRNFPTKNWEFTARDEFFGGEKPASEIETRFVMEIIDEYKPVRILTLHAPFKVVNYDGEAREISEQIANIIKYPVEESIGYPTPGSFGTYAGIEKNIPTITLELDEICPVEELISPVHKIFDMLKNA